VNKRSSPRFPVTLDVNVTFPDHGSHTCSVRDYCTGGMYLLCDRDAAGVDALKRGQAVAIEFSDPLVPTGAPHRLEGQIVRFETHGMGIAFTQENASAIIALSQLAASQSASAEGVAGSAVAEQTYGHDTVDTVIKQVRDKSAHHAVEILHDFFDQAKNRLFDAAGQSSSNVQQSAYFGAMNELRKGKEGLSEAFLERLNEQFDILTTPGYRNKFQQEAEGQGGLSLVESDELDKWLAVRAMASKLEERLGETLEALEMRFEEVGANPVNLESNPAGPFVLSSIFREMLNRIVLEEVPRKLLFSVMEDVLAVRLKKLYDELNETMISHGILPTIRKKMEVVKKPGAHGAPHHPHPPSEMEGESASAEGGADYGYDTGSYAPQGYAPSGAASSQSSAGAPPPQGRYAQPAAAAPQAGPAPSAGGVPQGGSAPQQSTAGGQTPQPAGGAQTAPQPNPVNYTRPSNAPAAGGARTASSAGAAGAGPASSHAVQELMRMQQPVAEGESAAAPPPGGYYTSGQVMQALGHLDQAMSHLDRTDMDAMDHVNYLSRSLVEATGEEGKALSEQDQETVTYVGGMFSSIHQDNLLAEQAKPWFNRLEVPLLKAGILDPSLLEDESHPARELLNRLESIGDLLQNDDSPEAQEARDRIEAILANINNKVETEPDVFAEALGELNDVQDKVEGNYEENIKKLIKQCEQEKQVDDARRIVLDELNKRLGKRDVPLVVLHLLDSGWKNLLLRTMMKSGADNPAFKTYLQVVDLLTARLTRSEPFDKQASMLDEDLLEWASRMLSMVSSNEQKNSILLRELAKDLSGQSTTLPETKYVPALVAKSRDHEHRAAASKPAEVADDVWMLMLEDAKQLHDREAFHYKGKGGKKVQVNLVWRDENRRFVFADNLGNKALDIELGEVATNLYNKILARMNEKELSVTERATYSFLQSLHNQIAYQANHDELTGLYNRKAFEGELEKAVEEAKKKEVTHVLGYFDLDRFNIINTTCGHAQGDELLKKVAEVLQETLDGEAIVSRLGGDEFGIILKNSSRTKGLKMLTDVHDTVRDIRFACDNNEFKVTCSMGVTEINDTSESSGRLLSAVDSATFTAKDNGRDNIQIYNVENERISSRRHILDWVGRINVLFDKNLIQFRCQKIAPVHRTINSLPHYEVLLDVHDEEGNKVPLDEFIVAAERYNRITDIDTWVVNYIFNWLEEHKSKLDRISNLSVNLSGNSLGNRHFMDEVYLRLTKPGFPADKVCFELTETTAMSNMDNAARFMKKLKETGCSFSLDDFGSGTSSYSYLRSLPIDYLKIDGDFVKDIATNSNDYAVVKSINEIGHVMGKQTVAEGVEDEFAYQLLHDIGIDYVQGFGVEKPIQLFKLFS